LTRKHLDVVRPRNDAMGHRRKSPTSFDHVVCAAELSSQMNL
jgi:hypothetical protein